jgi:hypothetical protein
MGQAVVDLPDPLAAPPPSNLSGTDDLLAQLAGDEIDRLLAEADVEQRSTPTPAGPTAAAVADAPTSAASSAPSTPGTSVAEPLAAPAVANASAPSAAAPATAQSPVPADDELDALLNKLNDGGSASLGSTAAPPDGTAAAVDGDKSLIDRVPEILAQFPAAPTSPGASSYAVPATPAAAAVTPGTIAASTSAAILAEATDGVMSAAERDALKIGEFPDDVDASPGAKAESASSRLAPVIKLLEWINAPLSFVPDALRDTLGKVAIVTLVNSIAVLIYVMFVRH